MFAVISDRRIREHTVIRMTIRAEGKTPPKEIFRLED